ncbi:hypothetical protein J4E85_002674 [Alternaria conjuncta]|uniref:uncharacterized protein n=1 Tax=Alternaria conjuncta TaxID=181017 RepID=UPI00221F6C57|nr:uncharacterized protein J4E85_002674 [Alternaria conjuncta]KAI4934814.1 hypothetical protein J4E85_002674 [Alternaria conjuncta]
MVSDCTGLADLLTCFTPVQDSVLRHLDIGDIIALSRAAKAFTDYVRLVERTQFNINEKLKVFVTSPNAFRSLQAKHNILISGSFAFGFMLRIPLNFRMFDIPTTMLDRLLVERGPHAEALRSFLENEGYRVKDSSIPNHPFMERDTAKGCQTVYIRETEYTPLFVILNSILTCDVNFITWNKAYSVFPDHTFILKQGHLLMDIKHWKHLPQELAKWMRVGIDIAPCSLPDALLPHAKTDSTSTLLGNRLVGDKRSWVVSLNTDRIEPSPFPDLPIDYAGFEVTRFLNDETETLLDSPSPQFNHYTIEMTVVESFALRYQYIFADKAYPEQHHFRGRTIVQLYALGAARRPSGFAQIFAQTNHSNLRAIAGFVPPESWKYYDDEMHKFLEARYPELSKQVRD